jgi:DNA-directed RNA polymerase subunit F
MFDMMLEQGLNYTLSDKETFDYTSKFEQLQRGKRDKVVNYFMNIKDKTILEELRFY